MSENKTIIKKVCPCCEKHTVSQIPAVIAAVQEGTLEESVIDDACLRVLRCKDTFLGIPESDF